MIFLLSLACDSKVEQQAIEAPRETSQSKDDTPDYEGREETCGDIPLGTSMYSPHVSCFSLYGEFVDDAVLDFYTLQPSHYVFLGKRVKKITLYFTNGYLIKKRYSFDQDIFINPTFMIASGKKQEFERGTDLLIKYKGRKFRYERRDAFHLVEEL